MYLLKDELILNILNILLGDTARAFNTAVIVPGHCQSTENSRMTNIIFKKPQVFTLLPAHSQRILLCYQSLK